MAGSHGSRARAGGAAKGSGGHGCAWHAVFCFLYYFLYMLILQVFSWRLTVSFARSSCRRSSMASNNNLVNSPSESAGSANGPSLSDRREKAITSLNNCVAFLRDLEDFIDSPQSASARRVAELKRKNKGLKTQLGDAESKYSALKSRFKRLSLERDELASWKSSASYMMGQFRAAEEGVAEQEMALYGRSPAPRVLCVVVEEEDPEEDLEEDPEEGDPSNGDGA